MVAWALSRWRWCRADGKLSGPRAGEGSMIDHTQAARAERGLALLRIVLAALLLAHGVVRFWHGGVAPFGQWLDGQGIPFGLGVAWFITVWELTATWLLAFGPKRWLPPLCSVFIAIYACGLWLVHAPEGWFVVGAGRNGMEYSALLIACLLLLAGVYWPAFRRRR
jgi:putative oxidoreductase